MTISAPTSSKVITSLTSLPSRTPLYGATFYLNLPHAKSAGEHPTELLVWKSAAAAAAPEAAPPAKHVFLMIPGNPGVVDYYQEFLSTVHDSLAGQVDIICTQHLGHAHHAHSQDGAKQHGHYTLQDQIRHKLHLIDHILSVYPSDTVVHLAGHSVGSWITLQVLKVRGQKWAAQGRLGKVMLLFPTIAKIFHSSNGQTIGRATLYRPVRFAAQSILSVLNTFLPHALTDRLVSLLTDLPPEHHDTTLNKLLHPHVARHALGMGADEMHQIAELDVPLLDQFMEHLILYYGANDGWVPRERYDEVKRWWPEHPGIYLCQDDFAHAFVLDHGRPMGVKVAGWIREAVGGDAGVHAKGGADGRRASPSAPTTPSR
ncbi:hypothetical protein BCR44DRAFT_123990 [Catenaria anguillulae PL171]|uniref:Alpha/Beta hydrolase protein n=1 Tax=Catenaria anguillulae PL171 TaxID=765915 RepID=A0A1Y2HA46_9FUNG|nr:hypothetical protein BCR44DRAFT_123990 [Catenaria anguillulae PL171]